jgi:hypothetical protein
MNLDIERLNDVDELITVTKSLIPIEPDDPVLFFNLEYLENFRYEIMGWILNPNFF